MKWAGRACVFALLGFSMLLAPAQDTSIRPLSFEVNNLPIRPALAKLFAGRSSFVLSADVGGNVTMSVKDTSFSTVLRYLLLQVDGTSFDVNGVYVIVPKCDPQQNLVRVNADARLYLQMENVDVKTVLSSLFRSTTPERKFTIDPKLAGTISGAHLSQSLEESVCWVAEQVGGQVRLHKGVYDLEAAPPDSANRVLSNSGEQPQWADTKVTLKEDHADIRDALRALFRQLKVNYSIAPEVQGTVSCDVSGEAEPILWRLLGAVHAYFRMESGVVEIVRENRPTTQKPPLQVPRVSLVPSVNVPARIQQAKTPAGLKFVNANIADVLNTLFTRMAMRYRLKGSPAAKVTADLSKIPLVEALQQIANQTSLSVSYEGDVLVFGSTQHSGFLPPGITLRGGPEDFIFNMIRGPSPEHNWIVADPG